MKEIIINHFLNYEFVYIFLFCFIIFLLISVFFKQKILRKISVLISSICFILFCFEFILSFIMILPQTKSFRFYMDKIDGNIYVQKEIEFFDENNKKYKYKIDMQYFDEKDYDKCSFIFNQNYSVYSNNFRVTKCNNESEDVFLFLGCSFVFGDGIGDDETLPYCFSQLFDFKKNVINCGVSANSSNTALNILNNEIFLPLTKNKNLNIKVCFVNLMSDHIYRNFRYEGICLDGYLYKNNKWYIPTKIGKIKYIFARSYIFRKIFVPIIDNYFKHYYEYYMIESLKLIDKIIKEKYNSKLTIVIWDKDGYSEFFIKQLKEIGVDLIFLPEYFNSEENGYRIKNDGHPTAKANKEVAEILYNYINDK